MVKKGVGQDALLCLKHQLLAWFLSDNMQNVEIGQYYQCPKFQF